MEERLTREIEEILEWHRLLCGIQIHYYVFEIPGGYWCGFFSPHKYVSPTYIRRNFSFPTKVELLQFLRRALDENDRILQNSREYT